MLDKFWWVCPSACLLVKTFRDEGGQIPWSSVAPRCVGDGIDGISVRYNVNSILYASILIPFLRVCVAFMPCLGCDHCKLWVTVTDRLFFCNQQSLLERCWAATVGELTVTYGIPRPGVISYRTSYWLVCGPPGGSLPWVIHAIMCHNHAGHDPRLRASLKLTLHCWLLQLATWVHIGFTTWILSKA